MKVLVNGIGNIGSTLLNLLSDYKGLLGIDVIFALKNTSIHSWKKTEIMFLKEKGIIICTKNNTDEFVDFNEIKKEINYIFDCNANSFGFRNKEWYKKLPNLFGCSAQGSEKGFGIPHMAGLNDKIILNQKFVQIVSCNTHSLAAIIDLICPKTIDLIEGDFVIVRRSEDLGNHERLVSANVISRHLDKSIGTHHSIDVKDLFRTKNIELNIQSSDITTPSQLLHAVRFNLKTKNSLDQKEIFSKIKEHSFLSETSKFDSNIIFELGRKYGAYGRIYSHAIILTNNLIIEKNNIKGWAFIAQEGNTLISTINAYLIQTKNNNIEFAINKIKNSLILKEW